MDATEEIEAPSKSPEAVRWLLNAYICAGAMPECEMKPEIYAGDPAVLSCWKDIARYLGKGVRTVQRWERDFDLPVRRPKGSDHKSAVAAHPRDLDAWLASRWSLRSGKETADLFEPRAALSGMRDQIEASRALRAERGSLIHELSAAMRMLVQNCDRLSKAGISVNAKSLPVAARRIPSRDFGLGSLPMLLETQGRPAGEEQPSPESR